ncbi:MAG: hypothetical protein IJI74_00040 [Firmicutes bacterium]|nr:hypothetical protein [Bacillota bacterium]
MFEKYDWKGNVRELKNVIESMVIICDEDTLKIKHIPDISHSQIMKSYLESEENSDSDSNNTLEVIIKQKEIQAIRWALDKTDGNKAKAAKILGISPQSLNYKLKKFNIM